MGRCRGLLLTVALATAATIAIAWPVVTNPRELVYGHEIAGRHHDAYTVMLQIAGSGAAEPYAQPLTDRFGWLLARVLPPVAAYNLLVLLSFPLTAAATYALARHLTASHEAALVAAFVFTFAPVRLAHAAYHPHIVQTQWLPLYLLALVALIERASWPRVLGAALACGALVLSNFYNGLIGALVTPVMLVAYWAARRPDYGWRSLAGALAIVSAIAAAGLTLVAVRYPQVVATPQEFAFAVGDVARYSAHWWAYFVPSVDHPLAGDWAKGLLVREAGAESLVEQQIYLGYAVLVLAAIATATAVSRWRSEPQWRPIVSIVAVGIAAALVSLGPFSRSCRAGSWAPACLVYQVAPMFRSYARFAIVVDLAVAIAAGSGAVILARRSRTGLAVAASLLVVGAVEYWPFPWRAHDVLPTAGHRWLARQPGDERIFDCSPAAGNLATVPWLMNRPVTFADDRTACADPQIGERLSALQYTHLLFQIGSNASRPADGAAYLTAVARFPDSRVYAVSAASPAVVTVSSQGFFAYEQLESEGWRWMGPQAQWTIRNTTARSRQATLALRVASIGEPRTLVLTLDDRPAGRVDVDTNTHDRTAGPWIVPPGDHQLVLRATGAPVRPSDSSRSRDTRWLTVMFKSARWSSTAVDGRP